VSDRVDIVVTVDGTPVPLCVEVATMILALVDHQQNIHKQGTGQVALHYKSNRSDDVEIAISHVTLKKSARRLILR